MRPLTADEAEVLADNLHLVPQALRASKNAGLRPITEDDLQDGIFGLASAIQQWDPDDKASLSTFSFQAITWAVLNGRQYRESGQELKRSRSRGDTWVPPARLDAPLASADALTLADTLLDAPSEPTYVHPRVKALIESMSETEQAICLLPSREAAGLLGIKQASVLRRRARLYDRFRSEAL